MTSGIGIVTATFPPLDGTGKASQVHYVVFKGSSDARDMLQNISIQYTCEPYQDHGVGVHSSFHGEARNRMLHHVEDIFAHLNENHSRLIITGHSQGGAHATALFASLKLLHPKEPQAVDKIRNSELLQRLIRDSRLVVFASPMIFARVSRGPMSKQSMSRFLDVFEADEVNEGGAVLYILRDDPVGRAYSQLRAPEPDQVIDVAVQGVPKIGGLCRMLRFFGVDVDSMVADVCRMQLLQDYVDLSQQYVHVMPIRLMDGDMRQLGMTNANWSDYAFTKDALKDHSIQEYAKHLQHNGTRVKTFRDPCNLRDVDK